MEENVADTGIGEREFAIGDTQKGFLGDVEKSILPVELDTLNVLRFVHTGLRIETAIDLTKDGVTNVRRQLMMRHRLTRL